MFGLALLFLFLSLIDAVLGFSGIAEDLTWAAITMSFISLAAAMVSLSVTWKPRSTCFIYPTFSCTVP
jgi:uncharacterized membrane protein YtjA (UPF0391 family)